MAREICIMGSESRCSCIHKKDENSDMTVLLFVHWNGMNGVSGHDSALLRLYWAGDTICT